jgi:hypothetical protein
VISVAILFINLFELSSGAELGHPHVFSIVLIVPFIAATLALLRFNWCDCMVNCVLEKKM